MREHSRAATYLGLFALAVALVGFFSLSSQMRELRIRIAHLERGPVSPPPAPAPGAPPEPPAIRTEMDPDMVRGLALRDCHQRLDDVAQELKLEASLETKVREAFADEFSFYADGVVRAFEGLQSRTAESNVMNSPEFQRKLEERILATDQKVAQVLTVSQRWAFEKWRGEMRKEFYGLE